LNLKNIFLLDGSGAVLSAVVTGLLLPSFSGLLGLAPNAFYSLAVFPLIYAVYSFSCFFLVNQKKPWMLLTIIVANLFYCVVSASVLLLSKTITSWGRGLLVMEIVVIIAVVAFELHVYQKNK
jgi:hypothetical protein